MFQDAGKHPVRGTLYQMIIEGECRNAVVFLLVQSDESDILFRFVKLTGRRFTDYYIG